MQLLITILLLATLAVAKKPNILFVLTDDQGKYVGGLEYMPKLQVTNPNIHLNKHSTNAFNSHCSSKKELHFLNTTAPSRYAALHAPTSGLAACHTTPT